MQGQSLIEAVIALSVLVIVLTTVTVAVILGTRNSTHSKNDNLATQYAQQGLEYIRQLRDTDWTIYSGLQNSANNIYKLADPIPTGWPSGTETTSCAVTSSTCTPIVPNSAPLYVREVKVEQASADCQWTGGSVTNNDKKVTVTVFWSDPSCTTNNGYCRRAQLSSCLVDNRPAAP